MCLLTKQKKEKSVNTDFFFKALWRVQNMSWTLKNGHAYLGKNKSINTEAEHTYISERHSMKDEGVGTYWKVVHEDNVFYIGYIG